jgi:hypothetical protein
LILRPDEIEALEDIFDADLRAIKLSMVLKIANSTEFPVPLQIDFNISVPEQEWAVCLSLSPFRAVFDSFKEVYGL